MEIHRRSEPTKLDTSPRNTRCIVTIPPVMHGGEVVEDAKKMVYVQIASDENNPVWILESE